MALRDAALEADWQVVAGHCLDLADSSLPYLPFSEILGRLMADLPDVAARVLEVHPTLARLQPGRRIRSSETASGDQALDRGNVYDAFGHLLAAVAERAPVLVVVEDAHWADESTRDMLSFLFSRPVPGVALVVSYRADDLHRRHPLRRQVAEWMRLRGVDRLQVEPLADDDVRRLVRALHPSTLSEAEYVSIVDRAEGNPFFIEELVGAAWSGQVPGELADVLLVHLDRLDETTRRVVRLVSVAGPSGQPQPAGRGLRPRLRRARGRAAHRRRRPRPRRLARRHLRLPARAARRGGLRRPAARRADAAPRRLRRRAGGGPRHRHGGRARAARPPRRRPPGRRPRLHRGGRGGAGRRRPVGGGDPLPRRARADRHRPRAACPTSTPSRWPAGAPRRSIASGRVPKAVKVLRARLAALPAEGAAVDRGQLLTALASALLLTDTTDSPREIAAEAVELLRERPAQAARPGAPRPRPEPGRVARRRGAERRRPGPRAGRAQRPHQPRRRAPRDRRRARPRRAARARAPAGGRRPSGRGGPGSSSPSSARSTCSAGSTTTRATSPRAVEVYREVIERSEVGGLTWSPYPAEARLLLAVALTHQGLLDEAWDLLDVSGQNPPMVYEWLYFAHQMLITIGIRGHRKEHALERLRDYWGTDGLTAISSGGAEIMRATAAGDAAARGVGLRRRGRGRRAAVARVVPGAAAARDPRPGRARRCGAAPVGRRARVGGARRRAPDGRRRPGDRLLRALRRQPRPRVPHVGGPPHRRAPALALARAGRPALGRRARRGLARRRGDRRRLRQRPGGRADPGAAGRGAARGR